MGLGEPLSSHRTVVQAVLERKVSEKRRDLFRGGRGPWGSQVGMDLPDPIGWQLERERVNGREKSEARAGKASAACCSSGGRAREGRTQVQMWQDSWKRGARRERGGR